MPEPRLLVENPRSNRRGRCSAGIPAPLSSTSQVHDRHTLEGLFAGPDANPARFFAAPGRLDRLAGVDEQVGKDLLQGDPRGVDRCDALQARFHLHGHPLTQAVRQQAHGLWRAAGQGTGSRTRSARLKRCWSARICWMWSTWVWTASSSPVVCWTRTSTSCPARSRNWDMSRRWSAGVSGFCTTALAMAISVSGASRNARCRLCSLTPTGVMALPMLCRTPLAISATPDAVGLLHEALAGLGQPLGHALEFPGQDPDLVLAVRTAKGSVSVSPAPIATTRRVRLGDRAEHTAPDQDQQEDQWSARPPATTRRWQTAAPRAPRSLMVRGVLTSRSRIGSPVRLATVTFPTVTSGPSLRRIAVWGNTPPRLLTGVAAAVGAGFASAARISRPMRAWVAIRAMAASSSSRPMTTMPRAGPWPLLSRMGCATSQPSGRPRS